MRLLWRNLQKIPERECLQGAHKKEKITKRIFRLFQGYICICILYGDIQNGNLRNRLIGPDNHFYTDPHLDNLFYDLQRLFKIQGMDKA